MISQSVLLLVLPVPVFRVGEDLFFDSQAQNGLQQWLRNFDRIILAVIARNGQPLGGTTPLRLSDYGGRCELVLLPERYGIAQFLLALPTIVPTLDKLIDRSTHLHFAIGGLAGDWAAVGALLAHRKGRTGSVWTDRVESEVTRLRASTDHGLRRIYRSAIAYGMKHYERFVIRRTALGLFHGADCFNAYAAFSPNPHLVHDIHLKPDARITPTALAAKCEGATHGRPLNIVYAGRAHPDKGVMDWIEALLALRQTDVPYVATWYGDGPELEAARRRVQDLGLSDRVHFPGRSDDRESLMRALQMADIFLFCHKTPESPRCLIEALISGTPIFGYRSAYPEDLIAKHGGGTLTPMDPQLLAEAVRSIDSNRERLQSLFGQAASDGYPHTDEDVFRHRADLIKAFAGA